ncbi:LysE family transporter [Paenibacillus larvae]|uniref:Uncharacterized protein n=1 Tax=Paenibacillus larvae subsp. pulvifaciens TaxID=1477 RepID=A0A1U9YMR2_9BACL|nr:hypothetical protein B5S25_08950 [Paenibacillus larvae subsp. pulvifaciens]ARF68123.1 hypothetical protein B7C51_10215 [Paenibacillus larvae subsp. pulvifaciens]
MAACFNIMKLTGAAYLLWLGWQGIRSKASERFKMKRMSSKK